MLTALQVVTLMLVALAMVPAVAHTLEFPGKKRLSKDAYLLAALILLSTMHAVYWLVTAPVNKVWLEGQQLSKAGLAFFRMQKRGKEAQEVEWTALRDRWEYSHIARAVLVTTALALLVTALATD
jgi:hypothetical protein